MKKLAVRTAWFVLAVNVALLIATQWLSMKARAQYPAQGEFVTLGDQQLHYIESGMDQGSTHPAVVLIHGASTSALDFSNNLQATLSNDFHVIAIDRPGHGYSERGDQRNTAEPAVQAKQILDALHTLNIPRAVLVGHSWAGSVVLAALLAEHNEVDVQAGVLIAGVTHPWDSGNAWHVDLATRPLIGDVFLQQYVAPVGRLMLDGALSYAFAPEAVPDGYVDDTGLSLSLRPSAYKNNALDLTQLSDNLRAQSEQYARIDKPLLSIASRADQVVPAWNHHDRLVRQIDHLQTLQFDDAGHAPHHTRPTVVAERISAFVQSLP